MHNPQLAQAILKKLDEVFPRSLHLRELRSALPAFKGVPDDEWLSAIQALVLEHALFGKFSSEGNTAALTITESGRQRLRQPEGGTFSALGPSVGSSLNAPDSSVDQPHVFLCYSHGDRVAVRKLYYRLKDDGFMAWVDEEDMIPGEDWGIEVGRAVRNSNVVVVCLSASSITKEGDLQHEMKLALDVADEQPPGTIFLIPARLDNYPVPQRLAGLQTVDLNAPGGGYRALVDALRSRHQQRA